ncbi:MAG TPA: S1 family peptidase [Candidatus Corynebacterium gallistercoris]|uniref:S1 family peptidase n=1 Tax=Candidatus Corynebacterium gallistercoris TaxID=2838530 RepID=A0A9D1UQ44_9CORY|nr:S1 family peptidase [Candidatus Corynebacterium gallistercoris]
MSRKSFIGRAAAALTMAAGLLAGQAALAPAEAQAQPPVSSSQIAADVPALDAFFTFTGQPGSRVPGHYFTSPKVPAGLDFNAPLVGASTPILVGEDSLCTMGAVGTDSHGNKVGITAGHCGKPGNPVYSFDATNDRGEFARIGTFERAGSIDYGVVKLDNNVQLTNSYNNVKISNAGGAVPGLFTQLCKTGITTGGSCGPALIDSGELLISQVCASTGDSGGPVYVGDRLVGIVSAGLGSLPSCFTPLQGPIHAPLAAVDWNKISAELNAHGGTGAGFKLA